MNPFRKKASDQSMLILDTCALIDARILEIARAGFVSQNVVIPQFVIAELQFLADKGDSYKRERARHGLDVIRALQDMRRVRVTIARDDFDNLREVDDKLVALAKRYGGMLYTTDYNLNKVAQIEGVTVLNVNELAHALRPKLLPGEQVQLKILQPGENPGQGVGYLDDGTMVVVQDCADKIGQLVTAECTRMLQTQAGKMMFANLIAVHAAKQATPAAHGEQHKTLAKPQKQTSKQQLPQAKGRGVPSAKSQPAAAPSRQPQSHAAARSQRHPVAKSEAQPKSSQQVYHAGRPRKKPISPEDSLLAAIQQHQGHDK